MAPRLAPPPGELAEDAPRPARGRGDPKREGPGAVKLFFGGATNQRCVGSPRLSRCISCPKLDSSRSPSARHKPAPLKEAPKSPFGMNRGGKHNGNKHQVRAEASETATEGGGSLGQHPQAPQGPYFSPLPPGHPPLGNISLQFPEPLH